MLVEQTQPTEALAAYERSIEFYPRRFNSLLGAARAARALGDKSLARTFYQELLEVADGGARQPAMKEAEKYVSQPRRSSHTTGVSAACRPTRACSRRRSAPPLMPGLGRRMYRS